MIPLSRNVLIQPKEKETISKGGIIIPDPSQHNDNTGIVLAVAEDVDEVEAGDMIKFELKNPIVNEDGSFFLPVERVMFVY
jgi:co-chaperonin GroES (HSP10)